MCVFEIVEFLKILAIFGPVVAILNFQDTSLSGFQSESKCLLSESCLQ